MLIGQWLPRENPLNRRGARRNALQRTRACHNHNIKSGFGIRPRGPRKAVGFRIGPRALGVSVTHCYIINLTACLPVFHQLAPDMNATRDHLLFSTRLISIRLVIWRSSHLGDLHQRHYAPPTPTRFASNEADDFPGRP